MTTKPKKPATAKPRKSKASAKPKSEQLIDMLSREGGATAPELIKKFDVLPHTLRGMISTLRSKRGFKIKHTRVDGVTTYKVNKG